MSRGYSVFGWLSRLRLSSPRPIAHATQRRREDVAPQPQQRTRDVARLSLLRLLKRVVAARTSQKNRHPIPRVPTANFVQIPTNPSDGTAPSG